MELTLYANPPAGPIPQASRTFLNGAIWRLLLLCCALALGAVAPARATHFRYGNITWRTVTTDASKRTVVIKVSESFRRSYFGGNIVVGSVVNNADNLNFGDNTTTSINLTVTSVDVANDNFYGEFTVTHTYAAVRDYTAYFSSGNRLSNLFNNANGSWYVKTVVNAGTGNNSPVSTLPPVVNLATGLSAASFQLPANDPDGDPLSYSLATSADLGGIAFTNAPGLAINASTGVITFPTTGAPVGRLYDAVVKVSDGKTVIIVDFIIQITQQSTPPAFDYSLTPSNGYVYQVAPGTAVNFSVRATDSDPGDVVTLKAVGLPTGSSMAPALPTSGNPVTSAFSWTPTAGSLGTYVLTFVAQDAVGVQTNTSVTIQVSTKPTFDVPPTPSNGTILQIQPGTQVTQAIQASNADPATLVRIISATGLASATYSPALPTTAANPTSTQLSWMPVISNWGLNTVTFTAQNTNSSDKSTHQLQYVVNSPPSFTSTPAPASLNVVAGQPFSYNISITDPDLPYGDQLEIEDQNLPAWLTLTDNGNGTGTLTGTPAVSDAGNNPVTLVAADLYHHGASYGLITQSFTINVIPCTLQAVAQNATVALDANGQATVSSAQVDNGSTASCGIASITVSPSSFTCASVGQPNPVTLTVTDTYGNVSTATAHVTVTDNLAPTAVAQNVTVQLDANGQASVTAAQVNNGSSDNCAVATTTVSASSFTCANLGANPVTLTVTDVNGNVSTATATVTVVDSILPTITAPAAVSVSTDAGQCTATNVALGTATAADNCTVTVTSDAPAAFTKGTTTVTYTATDASGHTATATQTVTVTDNELPTITAPAAVAVSTDAGQCAATNVALGTATAADNCAGVTVTNNAPATYPKGNTTVTWTATDAAGNVATATQVVTVRDLELPTITAPAAVSVSTNPGQCAATNVALGSATAADNCPGVTVTNNAPATYPKGSTTVTWTATDAAGNVATATQTVTVTDQELPTITAPAAVTVSTNPGQCAATGVALGTATAADNCPGVVITNNAPATFAKGVTTVTWKAVDAAGNSTTAMQTVTVRDTELPTITAPVARTVSTNPGQCAATNVALGTATAGDNCPGVTVTNNAPASFPKGSTTVTWTATDAAGNVATATQTVVVDDTELPTITAPAAVSVSTNPGQCTATGVALGTATAGDNCPGVTVTNNAPAAYPKGNTTVTWTATDAAGNVATATQVVTVRDLQLPTITAPVAVTVDTNAGQCAATNVALGTATAADNCPGVTVTNNAPATFPKGTTTVTWTATDAAGNAATATQAVTVRDMELPAITAPAAVAVSTNPGQCAATGVVLGTATAADNCPGVVVTNNAPASYPKGVTTVTWTATDAAGNVATTTQTVTVRDTELPTITAPAAVAANTAAGLCSATVTLGTATAADNCPGVVVTNNAPASFPKGVTTVTWTATDAAGNVATATQTVTITDRTAPVALARNITLPLDINGQAILAASLVNNGSSDACGIATLAVSPSTFSCSNVGANTVTLTVTDASGNASTATATVTVVDNLAPTVRTRPVTVYLNAAGQATLTAAQVNNGSTDACGIASVVVSKTAFGCANLGANTVSLTVTDIRGNVASAPAVVTVADNIAPTLSNLPCNQTALALFNNCSATVCWSAPQAADNCSAVITTSQASGTAFPVGTTTVTITATDPAGNATSYSFTVTVLGVPMFATTSSPVVSGADDDYNVACYGGRTGSASVCVVGGCLPYTYQWSNGQTSASIKNLTAGTYTVVVTDANGAQITRSITLTQAPAVTATAALAFSGAAPQTIYKGYGCQYLTLKAVGDGGLGGYSYRWSPATGLSSTTSCLVTAAPTVTTTYTVTITDYNGCAAGTASITVNVVDVRCGSQNTGVTLCYNNQTLCVAAGSVPAYLNRGAKLGACGSGNTRTSAPEPTLETPFTELLLEAYPNPFQSTTTIHFRPVVSAATTVRVYDVLGHVVATLYNDVTEAGHEYLLTLDGQQLAAGIYFCRYESQGTVHTQRLTLDK